MIQNQGWAVGLLKQIRVPMRTCEAVLTANSDSENRGGLRTRPTRAPKDHTPSDVANIEEWNYWMGSPLGFWSGRRKVLTSSPSPHTIIPENRLTILPREPRDCYQATLRIDKLLGRGLPFLYALQQMLEKGWRYIGSPNLRHRLDSVKTTRQTFFEPRRFFRIGSLR